MTAQISDSLKFEDRWFSLACEPLGEWLYRRKNKTIRFKHGNTACWRGYQASWEIVRGRLYMCGITASWPDGTTVVASELFNNYSAHYLDSAGANNPVNAGPGVFAFWVTGTMRCTFGDIRKYEHIGYESVYEGELHLVMRGGFLVGQRIVHHACHGDCTGRNDILFDVDADFLMDVDFETEESTTNSVRPLGFEALVGRERSLAAEHRAVPKSTASLAAASRSGRRRE
jgi:hypothetical protein